MGIGGPPMPPMPPMPGGAPMGSGGPPKSVGGGGACKKEERRGKAMGPVLERRRRRRWVPSGEAGQARWTPWASGRSGRVGSAPGWASAPWALQGSRPMRVGLSVFPTSLGARETDCPFAVLSSAAGSELGGSAAAGWAALLVGVRPADASS